VFGLLRYLSNAGEGFQSCVITIMMAVCRAVSIGPIEHRLPARPGCQPGCHWQSGLDVNLLEHKQLRANA